jgi:hypothetical protein
MRFSAWRGNVCSNVNTQESRGAFGPRIHPYVYRYGDYKDSTGNTGTTGSAGHLGYSGYSGLSGYCGSSGYSGYSGYSGTSGYSGSNPNWLKNTSSSSRVKAVSRSGGSVKR